MPEIKIKHGFEGQRLVVYPFYAIERALNDPLTNGIVVHSMGYFPNAAHHFIDRPSGCGQYILIYVTKGCGWFVLDNTRLEVEENQFFILPAEEAHQYGSSDEAPWTIYWIHFLGPKAGAFYQQLQGVRDLPVTKESRISDRKEQFNELLNVMENELSDASVNYVNLCVSSLLASFVYPKTYQQARYAKEKAENTFFISLATHYMNEHIDHTVTIDELASLYGYSRSYFYRLFVKETGFTPITYFNTIKMRRAAEMLTGTGMKVKQVAYQLGYDDPYYFSRLFKKIMGCSPAEIKKR